MPIALNYGKGLSYTLLFTLFTATSNVSVGQAQSPNICSSTQTKAGARALVVGINTYQSSNLPKLSGAVNDAHAVAEELTNSYGIPRENICKLLNQQATLGAFKAAVQDFLSSKTKTSNYPVFIYFAGLGSKAKDKNQDESDQYDETLLFYDSRSSGQDLIDDDLNAMLGILSKQTTEITIILDTSHSWVPKQALDKLAWNPGMKLRSAPVLPKPQKTKDYEPETLKHIAILEAANPKNHAFESTKGGIFTQNLIQALRSMAPARPNLAEVVSQLNQNLATSGQPLAYYQGNIYKYITTEDASNPKNTISNVLAQKSNISIHSDSVPKKLNAKIFSWIQRNKELKSLATILSPSEFVLRYNRSLNEVNLLGPSRTVRNRMPVLPEHVFRFELFENIRLHAIQKALLNFQTPVSKDLVPHKSIEVQLIPEPYPRCKQARAYDWIQSQPNRHQTIPNCHKARIQVELVSSPIPLYIGGLLLLDDGSIQGFPIESPSIRVEPGEKKFIKNFPLGTDEASELATHMLVFGTSSPVEWYTFDDSLNKKSRSPLIQLFIQYSTGKITNAELLRKIKHIRITHSYLSLSREKNLQDHDRKHGKRESNSMLN